MRAVSGAGVIGEVVAQLDSSQAEPIAVNEDKELSYSHDPSP